MHDKLIGVAPKVPHRLLLYAVGAAQLPDTLVLPTLEITPNAVGETVAVMLNVKVSPEARIFELLLRSHVTFCPLLLAATPSIAVADT